MKYDAVSRALHWLMAALLLGLIPLGLYMTELPLSPRKLQLYSWHKWAGVTVFALAAGRLAWRLAHPPPPLPWGMAPWVVAASRAGHGLLYVLMFAVPLTGWLMSSAKGVPTVWFGLVPLPDAVGKDRELGELLDRVHQVLAYLFAAAIAGHVAAALKHHFIDKDGLLARMA